MLQSLVQSGAEGFDDSAEYPVDANSIKRPLSPTGQVLGGVKRGRFETLDS